MSKASVIHCDRDGVVRSIERDALTLESRARVGLPLSSIVAPESFEKALDFLTACRSAATPTTWEWLIDGSIVFLAGAPLGSGLLVVAAASERDLVDTLWALHETSCGTACRSILQARSTVSARPQQELLDEFTQLYSEFVNIQRELSIRNAELERATAQRSEVLGVVAHDIRSPINAILNFADFLLEDAGDRLRPDERGFLERMHHLSQYLQSLIDGLLDVSKLDLGALTLTLQEHDLSEVVERAAAIDHVIAKRRNVSLRTRLPPEPCRMHLDAVKIEQVLHNLTGNAIRYSESGQCVEISLEESEDDLWIRVRDEGPGVPEHERNRIFEPYVQLGNRQSGSAGIGLAVAKGVVAAHGGSIGVEGKVGDGATFWVRLPRNPLEAS